MTHSKNALDLIVEFEGLRLTAYKDQRGILTIGYGHTNAVHQNMTISKVQAELYLNSDIVSFDVAINKVVKVPLTQNQFDALVCFVFNIGPGHFDTSTTLKLLNEKDYEGAANAMLLFNKVNGVANNGLIRRRTAEKQLFLKE